MNYISMFIFSKTDFLNSGFSIKVTCAFPLQEKHELSELNSFKPRKTTISSPLLIIIDLKLCLQYLPHYDLTRSYHVYL